MKYKKHGIKDLVKYIQLLETGKSVRSISRRYGINDQQLHVLWYRYQREGPSALKKQPNIRADGSMKEKIVRAYMENHLSLVEVSLKYNVSPSRVKVWTRQVREEGYAALYINKRRKVLPEDMGRKKKKEPETELEKLQAEVARLRAENDLLKKVKALVEAREARLKGIGRKPSKD